MNHNPLLKTIYSYNILIKLTIYFSNITLYKRKKLFDWNHNEDMHYFSQINQKCIFSKSWKSSIVDRKLEFKLLSLLRQSIKSVIYIIFSINMIDLINYVYKSH